MSKLRFIVALQTVLIVALVAILLYHSMPKPAEQQKKHAGLLSERVYSGELEPESLLINNYEPLKEGIQYFLDMNNISASVYVENLRNGASIGINENTGYFPASLNKLPVAVLILEEVEDGKLSLDSRLPIRDADRTDTFGTLHLTGATELPVKVLLEKMLRESDNTAFNVLYYHVDKRELAHLLGYYDIKINVDYPYRRVEYINHTDLVTATSFYNFFSSLYLSTVLKPHDSEYLLSLLANTSFDINRLANLPSNVTVAQKWGGYHVDNYEFFHDCGIMYIGKSHVFYCIMTKGLDAKSGEEAIGLIVNAIYKYVVYERSALDLERKRLMHRG